jgi:type II secretory pathway component PulK
VLDIERNKEIEAGILEEIKKLNRLFAKLDPKTKKAVHSLIENAAFMSVTLADLQRSINLNGVVSEYQNGENQWGTKKSPEVEVYNSMIKNHMGVMKQLTDLLPKQEPLQKDDGFDNFIGARDD